MSGRHALEQDLRRRARGRRLCARPAPRRAQLPHRAEHLGERGRPDRAAPIEWASATLPATCRCTTRLPSCHAHSTICASPVAASGWPRALRPPEGLTGSRPSNAVSLSSVARPALPGAKSPMSSITASAYSVRPAPGSAGRPRGRYRSSFERGFLAAVADAYALTDYREPLPRHPGTRGPSPTRGWSLTSSRISSSVPAPSSTARSRSGGSASRPSRSALSRVSRSLASSCVASTPAMPNGRPRRYLYPLAASMTGLVDCFGLQCQRSLASRGASRPESVPRLPVSVARRAMAARRSQVAFWLEKRTTSDELAPDRGYWGGCAGFGLHSRASRCASATWAGVILLATRSRFLTDLSRLAPDCGRDAARLNHMCATA